MSGRFAALVALALIAASPQSSMAQWRENPRVGPVRVCGAACPRMAVGETTAQLANDEHSALAGNADSQILQGVLYSRPLLDIAFPPQPEERQSRLRNALTGAALGALTGLVLGLTLVEWLRPGDSELEEPSTFTDREMFTVVLWSTGTIALLGGVAGALRKRR